jgi:hypothetical protein
LRNRIDATDAAAHWLTFSSRFCEEDAREIVGPGWSRPMKASRFRLPESRMHETGARMYFDGTDSGCVIDVPGEVCETWASEWFSKASLLDGKVTRIDLARDVGPAELARTRMLGMRRAWFSKKVETQIKVFEEARSYAVGDGFTWYFGGSTSPLRLRVYDRRGPLRLEFQWRPSDEERILAQIVARDLGACWRLLASRIQFHMAWYKALLVGDVPVLPVTTTESQWLKAAAQVKAQYGVTLWMLELLGIDMRELQTAPTLETRRETVAKLLKWAHQAGPDGEAARILLEPLLEGPGSGGSRHRGTPRGTRFSKNQPPCQSTGVD